MTIPDFGQLPPTRVPGVPATPTGAPLADDGGSDAVHRAMLAKLFCEFAHERLLSPQPDGEGWVVPGDDGATRWWFRATRHPLEHWDVDPASIRRLPDDAPVDPQQAVLDLRTTLGISDAVLPLYLEDLSATLYTAARRRALPAPSAQELARSPLDVVERHLDRGHPGFVANSGRVGMGAHELAAWAPEAPRPTRLLWLAARATHCVVSLSRQLSGADHLRLHLVPEERERFDRAVRAAGEDPAAYTPVPVHPWQWEHRILPGMLPDVTRRDLILVGPSAHEWRAQQSLRTFLDVTDPTRDYAKTALGVHSMGFLRGLSPAYMRTMPAISDWLHETVEADGFLRASGIRVLRERAAVGWTGDAHHRSGVASEHAKQLAALWRESPVPLLAGGEHAASLAGVLHEDRHGTALVRAWLERAGVSARDWVEALLGAYLVPVAHLLLGHDIALMPHGENVILRLRDGLPVGAFWKDLGEEVAVLSDRPLPPAIERIRSVVPAQTRELSVHTDVVDGVLRHLAVLLHEHGLLSESRFWAAAAAVLDDHRDRFPRHWDELDLFRESFAHSCLNRLQLRNPHRMVDLADPAGSLALAGRLANPLANPRAGAVPDAVAP